jgi:alkyl sulfatase BDS1-like metallo-beta-lactamase superfamily hydrolase
MYGALLAKGPQGEVDAGLGKTVTAGGTPTLIPPTDLIRATGETRTIDGVEFDFQMAPGTEAPAEMLIYLPQMKALCSAEDVVHMLHNLYTLRGAQVRDGGLWARAIDDALHAYGAKTEVVFAQHSWPVWGQERIKRYLSSARDAYKFINDQTLRLMNQGYTMTEAAEALQYPPGLARTWSVRGYYGTVNHDSKAVWQRYLGWYSGNPADLYPLPEAEAAKRYVAFMGGADKAVAMARESYAKGDYRWVAEVMKHVVFADPANQAARDLEADALEQLGYQSENGPWRNEFLFGAKELRDGVAPALAAQSASADIAGAMTDEMFLDYLAIHLDAGRAAKANLRLDWLQPDTGKAYAITVENGVLLYRRGADDSPAQATLTISRPELMGAMTGKVKLSELMAKGAAKIDGDPTALPRLLMLLDAFDPNFRIVAP